MEGVAVSVVTLPRRVASRPSAPTTPAPARHRAPSRSIFARWSAQPIGIRLALVVVSSLVVVMAGNSYVAQRQVEIHQLQAQLLQDQANYAARVAGVTNMAAPARVAAQAGHLHLVVPTQVTQIPTVPLSRVLPLPVLNGSYSVTTRTYQ
jgi:hypothetical protein